MGMVFPREPDGSYVRRPTRGLDLARVMHPEGGGLEFCGHAARARARAPGGRPTIGGTALRS